MVGLTKSAGFPVTGCLITSGWEALMASFKARSVPTRLTSPSEAEVCKRLSDDSISLKAGDSAS